GRKSGDPFASQHGPNSPQPFFAREVIVVRAVGRVDVAEEGSGAAAKLPRPRIPAAEALGEHGPVEVVAAPAKDERALEQVARIWRADEMDRRRYEAANRRIRIDCPVANLEKLAVDRIGTPRSRVP